MKNSLSLSSQLINRKESIIEYFSSLTKDNLPFYTSVDLRYSGYKAAVIDTNLFPAGFNNICLEDIQLNLDMLKEEIILNFPKTKNIGIIMESHTRNQYYLLNLLHLFSFIEKAGFQVKIFAFLPDIDPKGENLKLMNGQEIMIHSFSRHAFHKIDLFVLNNDLINGIPHDLNSCKIPVVPSFKAGWHSRLKSTHFKSLNHEINLFCNHFNLDPWQFNCEFSHVDNVDINNEKDKFNLACEVEMLLKKIQNRYDEYAINDIPFLFLKADSGTYGMGVQAILHPEDIINLNRKSRNKLSKGKGNQKISKFILQEGVYTRNHINKAIAEPCIYQIKDQYLGAFFRSHQNKTEQDCLNSVGMEFTKLCLPHQSCFNINENICNESDFFLFQILAKLASHACKKECIVYENQNQEAAVLS